MIKGSWYAADQTCRNSGSLSIALSPSRGKPLHGLTQNTLNGMYTIIWTTCIEKLCSTCNKTICLPCKAPKLHHYEWLSLDFNPFFFGCIFIPASSGPLQIQCKSVRVIQDKTKLWYLSNEAVMTRPEASRVCTTLRFLGKSGHNWSRKWRASNWRS